MEKIERPTLGTLSKGDKVIVIEPMRRQPAREHAGVVTKVARVWITVKHEYGGFPREARFRLDTQDDGGDSNYRWHFVTPEQKAYDDRMNAARTVLRDAGIQLDHRSPLQSDAMTLALAERVAALIGQVAP